MPEKRELFAEMSVANNRLLGGYAYRRDRCGIETALADVYARFSRLNERRTEPAGKLSGGERQMLALGRALMSRPRLLMLDESSLGVAPLIVREIFRIIHGLWALGVTILLVEQNARAALASADVIETGEIVMQGAAADLLHDPRIAAPCLGGRTLNLLPPSEPCRTCCNGRRRGTARALFRIGGVAWSYADMLRLAAAAAGRLRDAGLKPGDRLAVMCPNRTEFLELYLGCAWSGVIMVPINVASRGPQLRHVLSNSGARILVIAAELMHVLDRIERSEVALESVWAIEDLPPRGAAMPPHPSRPGDTVAILHTSGTTGPSKGVCCPHAQMYWWGGITGRLLELTADDVLCTTLPMFHANALNAFHQALLHGAAMMLEPRFSASGFWPSMIAAGATVTYVLGAMVPILMAQPPNEAERSHRLWLSLAPGVPGHLQAPFTVRTGLRMIDGYGSTETNFTLGTTVDHQRSGLMGPVVEGFESQVVDEDDNPMPDGVPGELVLRAHEPFAFATGYWVMPEKTVEAWRNLRFHAGDRVVREPDGWYRFMDRMKDAVRRRGENISAFEVEQVLLTYPEIAGAAVFPVRSELAEDEVMAAIIRTPGSTLASAAICKFCASLLAKFAIPRFIDFVDDLPLTENGKVRKFMLIERGCVPVLGTGRLADARAIRRTSKAPPAKGRRPFDPIF